MYIYIIQSKETGQFKIGKTKNIKRRLKQLQTGSSGELVIIDEFKTNYPNKLEKYLHNIFKHENTIGEWFTLCYSEVGKFKRECEKMEKNYEFLENNKKSIDY